MSSSELRSVSSVAAADRRVSSLVAQVQAARAAEESVDILVADVEARGDVLRHIRELAASVAPALPGPRFPIRVRAGAPASVEGAGVLARWRRAVGDRLAHRLSALLGRRQTAGLLAYKGTREAGDLGYSTHGPAFVVAEDGGVYHTALRAGYASRDLVVDVWARTPAGGAWRTYAELADRAAPAYLAAQGLAVGVEARSLDTLVWIRQQLEAVARTVVAEAERQQQLRARQLPR